MRSPDIPTAEKKQPSAFSARAERGSKPIDETIAAIERGKLIRSLLATSRPSLPARTTTGRGWGRHGHVSSNARKTA